MNWHKQIDIENIQIHRFIDKFISTYIECKTLGGKMIKKHVIQVCFPNEQNDYTLENTAQKLYVFRSKCVQKFQHYAVLSTNDSICI